MKMRCYNCEKIKDGSMIAGVFVCFICQQNKKNEQRLKDIQSDVDNGIIDFDINKSDNGISL